MTFSGNVRDGDRQQICNILGVQCSTANGNYLGLPMVVSRNKKEILHFIKLKIINRIQSWNHRFLSRAGREILLKTVLQALPTYAMGVFLLPKGLAKDIETTMNSYWWKGGSRTGINWKAWNLLSKPKRWGGLRFRDIHKFNLALLCKQSWI